nr:hypothetical protein [Tanacetum cinerariifolium]
NDARYGHYCTPQVLFIYPEPCYNQDFNFPQDFHDFQQQYLCCENCGDYHEAYQCQQMNEDYYHEQNSCYDLNSFGFDQFQPPQYTVNHPIFNTQNDLFNYQNKLMEQLTSMCDMVGQYTQKKKKEKQIEKEQAAKPRYWKIPVCCYDDDDDDYTIAITPKEPDNSLSMGDEHLSIILATESDKFIKSSVENLIPNPTESEGEYEFGFGIRFSTLDFMNLSDSVARIVLRCSSPILRELSGSLEYSSCGALYTTDYCCSEGSLGDKIICDIDKTPDLSQRSPQNCPKCGHPVDGHYCQGCALLRKKFKEDLFTYCIENRILQILLSHPMTMPTLLMLFKSHSLSNKTPLKIPHKVLHKSTIIVVTGVVIH